MIETSLLLLFKVPVYVTFDPSVSGQIFLFELFTLRCGVREGLI